MLPAVTATRYVTPLREGGSLPGLMEADDLGTYVVKWRAAGQGVAVLVTVLSVALGTLLRSVAGGIGLGIALVLVLPPLLVADGRRQPVLVGEALPALRVGAEPFLAGPDPWTTGVAVLAAWGLGGWLLAAALLERRDV